LEDELKARTARRKENFFERETEDKEDVQVRESAPSPSLLVLPSFLFLLLLSLAPLSSSLS
jgi:hypothetical protein